MSATPVPLPREKVLLSTAYFDVVDANGYKIVREPQQVNGVVVIPMLPGERFVLTSLTRRAVGLQMIELPRGKIDEGETAEEAALREYREETGMVGTTVKQLGLVHSNTSLLSSAVSVCLVETNGQVESETDGEVDFSMVKTLEELREMIRAGAITDGHTLSALMMYLSQR